MSKIFLIDPQTGNNYQGNEQTVTNVNENNLSKRFFGLFKAVISIKGFLPFGLLFIGKV